MAHKSKGFIKLEWTCPNCKTTNPGPDKSCLSCGAPQPVDIEFKQASLSEFITNSEEIEAIKLGPDIHCPYCGTRNPSDNETCFECGGKLIGGEKRIEGQVIGSYKSSTQSKGIKCPSCGSPNPQTNRNCHECGSPLGKEIIVTDDKSPKQLAKKKEKKSIVWLVLLGGFLLIICVILVVLFSKKKTEIGVVENVRWILTVQIEQFGPVTRESWEEEIPQEAVVQECEKAYHHISDEPEPISTEVCGTPYVIDEGTGHGEVVEDCSYEVYADWCTYSINDWYILETMTQEGSDFNPAWPIIQLSSNQRLGNETEKYEILFNSENDTYVFPTNDVDLFYQCIIGSEWELSINALNMLTGIKPAQP